MMGVDRKETFRYAFMGVWHDTDIPVSGNWHTFTYEFSGAERRVEHA